MDVCVFGGGGGGGLSTQIPLLHDLLLANKQASLLRKIYKIVF